MPTRRRRRAGWSFGRRYRWLRRAAALALLLAGWYFGRDVRPRQAPAPQWLTEGSYRVQRVVDGDTLLLDNGARVRLIGVDTPETVAPNRPPEPFGHEATAFTRRLVEDRTVQLRFDRERKDKYERYLAFVYVEEKLLNEELIRAGLSPAETRYSFDASLKRRFQLAEREARRNRRGIWSLPEQP